MRAGGGRAVVAGAGIAGLCAAAALAGDVDEVLVIERDALDGAGPRRGVPQGDQLHNLLTRAQRHLDQLFPGLVARIAARGGVADVAADTHVSEFGTVMPRRSVGLHLISASRPVIEELTREQLLADHDNVTVLEEARMLGIERTGRSVSAALVDRGAGPERFSARFVVDATGAGATGTRWCAELGEQLPHTDEAHADQWYVSARFRRPPDLVGDPTFVLVFPTPWTSRGGLVSPIDDEHWSVSLNGRSDDPAPETIDEMRGFAATLEDPAVAERLEGADPVGSPNRFRRVTASWRRYDLLSDPLIGLLPIGDALAALNPLHGQGVSLAAWQASSLREVVAEAGCDADLTTNYHHRAAEVVAAAWGLGPRVEQAVVGAGEGELAEARIRAFTSAIARDPELHRRYVGVWHLIERMGDVLGDAPLDVPGSLAEPCLGSRSERA